jgi:hypothetical protein
MTRTEFYNSVRADEMLEFLAQHMANTVRSVIYPLPSLAESVK